MQLNPDQQRVVDSDGHCLVVACPGSGKTRVITTKIGAIFKRRPSARVMAVTFTRESAMELSRRVIEEVGQEQFDKSCRIGTFHALAIRHLKLNKIKHRLVGPSMQAGLVMNAINASHADMTYIEATQIIEKAKGSLEPCEEQESEIFRAYQQVLARHKSVDLFDVIRMSVEMMRDGSIPPYPVTDMLVDEFQDTDNLQLAWVLEHAKHGTIVTVVGDDDQSIYSWRGANGYQGMTNFKEAVGAELITLAVNYRCHAEILGSAGKLIAKSSERIEKALHAERGPGGKVHIVRSNTKDAEVDDLLNVLTNDLVPTRYVDSCFDYTVKDGSWAVLARTRRQLDLVEQTLRGERIEVYRPPKESFWARSPQSDLLHLLEATGGVSTAGIETALEYSLRAKFDKHRAKLAMNAVRKSINGEFSRMLYGEGMPEHKDVVEDERAFIQDYITRMGAWRSLNAVGRHELMILGVGQWFLDLETGSRQKNAIEQGLKTLTKLKGSISERIRLITGNTQQQQKNKHGDELDRVSATEALSATSPKGVQLQTMHGSKGLEFDNVWIVGVDARTIPSPNSSNFEEERRLMYVGMTRAKNRLWLSSAIGEEPSVFIMDSGFPRPSL